MPVVEALPWKSNPEIAAPPLTVTTAELLAEPPAPVQLKVNVLLAAVSAPLLAEPEVARLPLHAPLAVHEVASLDDHVRVVVPPLATLVGLAVNVTRGAGAPAVTETVTDLETLPPLPWQLSE